MYEEIDKILLVWLKKYGLHVSTKYRDCEVRHFYVVDDVGDTYQVGISPLDAETDKIFIQFGIRKEKKAQRKSKTFETSLGDLENALEATYKQIMNWIEEFGHTRTPVL